MKIGIVINQLKSNAISGSHFEQSILQEVDSGKYAEFKFFVFTYSNIKNEPPKFSKNITYININIYKNLFNKYSNSIFTRLIYRSLMNRVINKVIPQKIKTFLDANKTGNALNIAMKQHSIDICWNIYSTEMVDIPYIATCLDCFDLTDPYLPENNRPNFWLSWNNFSFNYYRKSTYILASTQVLKDQLVNFYGVPNNKIKINPFFTPQFDDIETTFMSEDIDNIPDIKTKKDFLFYPSRYAPQKNHIVIIESIKILKENYNFTPKVIFCGRDIGNLKYIKFKIKEYGLSDQFTILGVVDFKSLIKLYKNAKALVYSSLVGPDNLPPLEAFSFNCPVIASNVSGAVEQLGDAALLFEPTDENKLSEHIMNIYQNETLVDSLKSKGKLVHESLNVEKYVCTVIELFQEFKKYRRSWE